MREEKFLEVFGKASTQQFFSPGRVNLIGEHIDYNGGMVFPMTINFGTYGLVNMRDDKTVRVYSLNFEQVGMIEFDIDTIKYDEKDDWANYVKGVIAVMIEQGYQVDRGFDLLVEGTIPNGSGLSSSASLEVLIGRILIDNLGLDIDGTKLALIAKQAENEFIGVNCGIMDQFIIANGTSEGALMINCDTLEYRTVKFDLGDNTIVVLNSNKKRGLVDSAYNERRQSCETAFSKAQEKFGATTLCSVTLEQLAELDLTTEEEMRARHAIEEQIRVERSELELSTGDVKAFGETLYEGHKSLSELFEVSCPELDFIVELAREHGAIGARMTGAGFGGCCVAVMPNDKLDLLAEMQTIYQAEFGLSLDTYIVSANDCTKRIK